MVYLSYLINAWLVLSAPLSILGYKPSFKTKTIFIALYTLGIFLFRKLYKFLPLPFGTHTILLIILNIALLTVLIKEISWIESIFISLAVFITMLINDALVVVPFMKYFNLSMDNIENGGMLSFFISAILANLLLVAAYITGILRPRRIQRYNLYKMKNNNFG